MSKRNDFIKFVQSKHPTKSSESIQKTFDYFSPHIIEEREMHATQLDVFSRLMMDRIVFFGDEVNSDTANIFVSQLLYLSSVSDDDITMYINSPGGEVYSGYGIIDTMMYIKPKVRTVCTGMAASMASILLACGSKGMRACLPHARVMLHQPLGGSHGQASDIEIAAKEINKIKQELFEILAMRSGQPIERIYKDADRDCWLTALEAKEYGLVDEVYDLDWSK